MNDFLKSKDLSSFKELIEKETEVLKKKTELLLEQPTKRAKGTGVCMGCST